MKCIQCGKKDAVLEYQCLECYLKKNPVIKKIPSKIRISVCRRCGLFFHENHESKSILPLIDKLILKKILYDKKQLSIGDMASSLTMDDDYGGRVKTILYGKINMNDVEIPIEIPVHIKESLCKRCARLSSNYYEGTLQIRGNITREMVLFIRKLVKASGAAVTSESRVVNGYDFLITDSQVIKESAYLLRKKYGGEVKISSTLFSRNKQTSKDIYRITALLRLPDFKVGDVMVTRRKILKIDKIDDYIVKGTNIMNFRKSQIDYKEVDYSIIKKEDIMKTTLSKREPNIEVIDPEDYQSKRVKNNPDIKSTKVNIIKIGNDIWVL